MTISLDFDGTCVTHEFPKVGKDIGSAPVLRELVEAGHNIILFTMRSDDHPGKFVTGLIDAVKWFEDNGIRLWGVNKNPTQHTWTTSPKAHADYYIDDCNLGIPLIFDASISDKAFVDWVAVREMLVKEGLLK